MPRVRLKLPRYWPEWAADIVREAAREYDFDVRGQWPDRDVLLERAVDHVHRGIDRHLRSDEAAEAEEEFWDRLEGDELGDDIKRAVEEFSSHVGRGLRRR